MGQHIAHLEIDEPTFSRIATAQIIEHFMHRFGQEAPVTEGEARVIVNQLWRRLNAVPSQGE